eukprot:205854_1
MLNILIFISAFLIRYSKGDITTEISNQVTTTQGLCDAFGSEYDLLGITLNTAITSINNKTSIIDATIDSINDYVHNLPVIETSINDLDPLKEELVQVTDIIKDWIGDIKSLLETNIEFGEIIPNIQSQMTSFESDMSVKNGKIQQRIDTRFSESTSNINNKFTTLDGNLNKKFIDLEEVISNEFTSQTPTVISSLSSFETNVNGKFSQVGNNLQHSFTRSTNNINDKFDEVNGASGDLLDKFGLSTGNIDENFKAITNDLDNKYNTLDDILIGRQKAVESAIVAIRQTVTSGGDNMKWSLQLKIDLIFGFGAKYSGVIIDGNEEDGLFIELNKRDVFIIGGVMIVIDFVFIIMVVYLIVDFFHKNSNK